MEKQWLYWMSIFPLTLAFVLFLAQFSKDAHSCSYLTFAITWPEQDAENVPLNARIIFYDIITGSGSTPEVTEETITFEDEDGNPVSGEIISGTEYGKHSKIFQPSSVLKANTEYTFSAPYDSVTFKTGNTIDDEAPEGLAFGVDKIVFSPAESSESGGSSCDSSSPDRNIIHLDTQYSSSFSDSVETMGSADLFVQFFFAVGAEGEGEEPDWDHPASVGSIYSESVTLEESETKSYCMAVVVKDAVGNESAAETIRFETLDGPNEEEQEIDEPLITSLCFPDIGDPETPPENSISAGCSLHHQSESNAQPFLSALFLFLIIFMFPVIATTSEAWWEAIQRKNTCKHTGLPRPLRGLAMTTGYYPRWLYFLSLFVVLGTIACGDGTTVIADEPFEEDFPIVVDTDCSQDSDCVLVDSRCCNSCNCGSDKTAVNISSVEEWNEELAADCADTDCLFAECDVSSCVTSATAICVDHECTVSK